jgi:hypothetical protein
MFDLVGIPMNPPDEGYRPDNTLKSSYKFCRDVPSYCWVGDQNLPEEFLATMLAFEFASAAPEEERASLAKRKSYLRFFFRQDGPDCAPYVAGVLRSLGDPYIYSSHRSVVESVRDGRCCLELSYHNRSVFLSIPATVMTTRQWSGDVEYMD